MARPPAGYAASCYLAKKGLSVVVIDAPRSHNLSCDLLDWVSAELFTDSLIPKSLIKSAKAREFSTVRYYDKALSQTVEHTQEDAPLGYFVSVAELTKHLHDQAVKKKVLIRTCKTQPAVSPNEDHVEIIANKPIRAKFLLVAQNHPTDVLNELGQPSRGAVPTALNIVGLDIPLSASAASTRMPAWAKKISSALHVVELEERTEMGMFFVRPNHLHVRVISSSPASGARTKELSAMIANLQKQGTIGADLLLSKATGAVWRPLAGGALEQEVHEAKRTLLIASAGGFSQSVTGHDLLPSIRSAKIAADTIIQAIDSKTPQDALMQFTINWRAGLADYLRPPNTSLSMLVPLLFVNEKIVSKFTEALIKGENI